MSEIFHIWTKIFMEGYYGKRLFYLDELTNLLVINLIIASYLRFQS